MGGLKVLNVTGVSLFVESNQTMLAVNRRVSDKNMSTRWIASKDYDVDVWAKVYEVDLFVFVRAAVSHDEKTVAGAWGLDPLWKLRDFGNDGDDGLRQS